jgi:hypothetical protein
MGVLVAAILITILAPVLYNIATARTAGYLFNGRYTLPIAAGIVILGARLAPRPKAAWLGPVRVVTATVVVANILAFVWVLRRYMVGANGPLNPFAHVAGAWSPPIPAVLLVAFFVIVEICTVGWWWAVATEVGDRFLMGELDEFTAVANVHSKHRHSKSS